MTKSKPPAWIGRYRKDYEEGRITTEEILKLENANREASDKPVLKLKSVARAINALCLSSRTKTKQEQEASDPITITKPCYGCKYYKIFICEYPHSMFDVYPELSDFDRDFEQGRCKLKEK